MVGVRVTGTALYMNSDIYDGATTYGSDYPEETEYLQPWAQSFATGLGVSGGVRQNVGGRIGYYYTNAYPNSNYYFWFPHYFGLRDEGSAHWMWHSFSFYKTDSTARECAMQIWSMDSDGFPGAAVTNSYTTASTSSTGVIARSTLSLDLLKPGWYYIRTRLTGTGRCACHYRSNGASGQSMGTMWNTLDATAAGTSSTNANQVYVSLYNSGNINLPTTRTNLYPMVNIRYGVDSNVEEAGAGTYTTGGTY